MEFEDFDDDERCYVVFKTFTGKSKILMYDFAIFLLFRGDEKIMFYRIFGPYVNTNPHPLDCKYHYRKMFELYKSIVHKTKYKEAHRNLLKQLKEAHDMTKEEFDSILSGYNRRVVIYKEYIRDPRVWFNRY